MRTSIGCFVILMATNYITATLMILHRDAGQIDIGKDTEEYSTENRQKRSMMTSALKTILKKAKHLYTNGYDSVYLKTGGNKQALTDFYSVRPTRIQRISKVETTGKVGNWKITVRYDSQKLTMSKMPNPKAGRKDTPLHNVILYED